MINAANGLWRKGHLVYFFGRKKSFFLERCSDSGFLTFPLEIKGDFGLINILKLTSFFISNQIDVIIANFNKDVRLAGIARRLAGKPVLLARNGLPILHNNWRYRLTYRYLVDSIITNTRAIKNQYLSYGWLEEGFIKVIHNGINIHQRIDFNRKKILARFNLPNNVKIVGIFGRLVKQKQHHLFLEVASQIRDQFKDVHFIIVGDGPLRTSMREKSQKLGLMESVHFLGLQQEVMPLYSICDVVLLTSETEGLPNVVMEAMLAASPVVAFDVGGVSELINSTAVGRTVVPNDVSSMVEETLAFLRNEKLSRETGHKARQRIMEEFSEDKMDQELETHLNSLTNGRI